MIKKEIKDILKKMLSTNTIDISQAFQIVRCLNGQTSQLGIAVADIIESAYTKGVITEDEAVFLIEEMVDEENRDRVSNPNIGPITIPDMTQPTRPWDSIVVMYGVTLDNSWESTIEANESTKLGDLIAYNSSDTSDILETSASASTLQKADDRLQVKYGIPGINKKPRFNTKKK